MIKLSKRLVQVADFVNDGAKIVDIGCDHGLTDIYILQTKKDVSIIASDINEKALSNAITNIKKYKLENKISTIVSDGLSEIDTDNIDTIIISGMGAHTIVGILQIGKSKLKNIDSIIIQSNNDLDFLREKVTKLGYYIEDEALVKEKKFIYTVIKFKKGTKHYNKKQLYFGPVLLEKNDTIFKEKNKIDLEKLKLLYKLIPKSHYKLKLKTYLKIKLYNKI